MVCELYLNNTVIKKKVIDCDLLTPALCSIIKDETFWSPVSLMLMFLCHECLVTDCSSK